MTHIGTDRENGHETDNKIDCKTVRLAMKLTVRLFIAHNTNAHTHRHTSQN